MYPPLKALILFQMLLRHLWGALETLRTSGQIRVEITLLLLTAMALLSAHWSRTRNNHSYHLVSYRVFIPSHSLAMQEEGGGKSLLNPLDRVEKPPKAQCSGLGKGDK